MPDPGVPGRVPSGIGPIRTVDHHTGGEPFRIVLPGQIEVAGDTVLARRQDAHSGDAERLRVLLCHEPRGHADMYGGLLVPPDDDGAHLGVLFFHKDGWSTACGHGTIALGAWAVESGLVPAPDDGETDVVVDVPSGRVTARVTTRGGAVQTVAFVNVGARVVARDVEVTTASFGSFTVDLAWGGALYAAVRAQDAGVRVVPEQVGDLVALGRQIKAALADDPRTGHPDEPRLSGLYAAMIWEPAQLPDPTPGWLVGAGEALVQRNVVVFVDGQVDRSPCGSGTSARLALLADAGPQAGGLAPGQELVHLSIVGSAFSGRVLGADAAGEVATEVVGTSFRTGEHSFWLDPRDDLAHGFVLR